MKFRLRIRNWWTARRSKKRVQQQLTSGFDAETQRVANQASKVTSPLAKKMIQDEVKQRKKIAKGETDGTRTGI